MAKKTIYIKYKNDMRSNKLYHYGYFLKNKFKNWDSDKYDWVWNFKSGHYTINYSQILTDDDLVTFCQKYKDTWIKDYLIYKLSLNKV